MEMTPCQHIITHMDMDMTPCLHIFHFNPLSSLTSRHNPGYGSILHITAHSGYGSMYTYYY